MTTEMTTERANELRDELEDVREAWREWTEQWEAFQGALRHGGYNTYRLDAYKVGTGFDEGGGQSMEGWLTEIETDLAEQSAPPTCAGGAERWCAIHDAAWLSGERHCEGWEA